jgi:hypothetical protein
MNNCCIYWFFTHMFTKCTVQETVSPVKISSGIDARRDLIPALKGHICNSVQYLQQSTQTDTANIDKLLTSAFT